MSAPRRSAFLAAQVLAAALLLFYVGRKFADQWQEFRAEPLPGNIEWGSIALSSAIVLATYAMLVQVWRPSVTGIWPGVVEPPTATIHCAKAGPLGLLT